MPHLTRPSMTDDQVIAEVRASIESVATWLTSGMYQSSAESAYAEQLRDAAAILWRIERRLEEQRLRHPY